MENLKILFNKYFLEKTDNGFIQFFRYIFVGGAATVVDIGSLYLLTSIFHVYYLISAAVAFLLGITANYLISILWVFEKTNDTKKEITLFLIIGVGGLLLNELIIWGLVEKVRVYYILAKVISTVLVLVWNFGMRKKFIYSTEGVGSGKK